MQLKSFRFRIALLSALLAALAVAGFSGVTYVLLYQSKLAAIDHEMKDHLLRESANPRPVSHWQAYEKSRVSFFGDDRQNNVALLVLDQQEQIIHQSANWESSFQANELFKISQTEDSLNSNSQPLVLSNVDFITLFGSHSSRTSVKAITEPLQESLIEQLTNSLAAQAQPPDNPPPRRLPPPNGNFPNRPLPLERSDQLRNPPYDDLEEQKLPPPPQRNLSERNLSNLITRQTSSGQWRIGTVSAPFIKIALAINLRVITKEMSVIQGVFLLAVPFTLVLVLVGAWWLSAGALKPVQHLTSTIRRINAKGLNQRAIATDLDLEFMELVQVFNQMMERLERSFLQASRFSADAAHELKTPLAILQGELELAVQQTEVGSTIQQTLSNLLAEVSRLSSITRKLLLLSLADAGRMNLQKNLVNVSEILQELAEDIDILAPELTLKLDIKEYLYVLADRDLLIQVLQNLITNAIKYNITCGWIQLVAKSVGKVLFVTVSNSSLPISNNDRERIFERFHRADPSRNRRVEGFGLGLSLSREIARAHHGNLQIDPPESGCTSFTLTLPVADQEVLIS